MFDQHKSLDNYVPQFGLLSTVKITPIVLIGIWMIFLPATIGAAVVAVSSWSSPTDVFNSLLTSIIPLFVVVIGSAILIQTTRRYLQRSSKT